MKEYLDEHPRVLEAADEAVRRAGLEPTLDDVRGGTDGSRLSERGLPTPNLFTGGHDYHSPPRVDLRRRHGRRRRDDRPPRPGLGRKGRGRLAAPSEYVSAVALLAAGLLAAFAAAVARAARLRRRRTRRRPSRRRLTAAHSAFLFPSHRVPFLWVDVKRVFPSRQREKPRARLSTVEPLVDSWGREIKSVRVSVTDKCNFRCTYCMPAEGLEWLPRDEVLTFEEIARLVRRARRMGVDEVRLTGGEPLVRRDLPVLVELLAHDPGRPRPLADDERRPARPARRAAGRGRAAAAQRLARLALATCASPRSRAATRSTRCSRGLEEAERHPELRPIKVNCVAIRGFTEEEVPRLAELARRKPYVVRFIEFMPLDADEGWREDEVLTGGEIRALIEAALAARRDAGEGLVDRAPLPLRRRRRRDRLRQPRLGAVLLDLRPDPADRRRPAPHLPLLAPRVGPEDAAPRRRDRRRARRADPLGGRHKELKHQINEPGSSARAAR